MIEVRIRDAYDSNPVFLCQWRADDLPMLIPTIQQWGLRDNDGERVENDVTGKFVLDGAKAYFELLIER